MDSITVEIEFNFDSKFGSVYIIGEASGVSPEELINDFYNEESDIKKELNHSEINSLNPSIGKVECRNSNSVRHFNNRNNTTIRDFNNGIVDIYEMAEILFQ